MQNVPAYYRLRLSPLSKMPKVWSNRRENYVWEYIPDADKRLCEIIYIQEGSLSEQRPDGEHTYQTGTVHTMVHDRSCRQYSKDPVYHEFILLFRTAGPVEPMAEEDVAQWQNLAHEAILPEYITDPAVCERIAGLLKSHVSIYRGDGITRTLQLQSTLLECLAIVTEHAVLQARQRQLLPEKRRSRPTVKACNYIQQHLGEKLPVQEIAQAIGINYHHLSRVFRKEMHMTLVEYITRSKIRRVEQLITVEGMTLAAAGAAVDIPEPKYLSRLFRRYTGLTVREYRQIYSDSTSHGHTAQ